MCLKGLSAPPGKCATYWGSAGTRSTYCSGMRENSKAWRNVFRRSLCFREARQSTAVRPNNRIWASSSTEWLTSVWRPLWWRSIQALVEECDDRFHPAITRGMTSKIASLPSEFYQLSLCCNVWKCGLFGFRTVLKAHRAVVGNQVTRALVKEKVPAVNS